MVIFRLGENVPNEAKPDFQNYLVELIEYICPKFGKMLFTTCFWKNPIVDDAIFAVAKQRGDLCVDLLSNDESMMALGKFVSVKTI